MKEDERNAWKDLLKNGWEARREGGYLTPNISGKRKKINQVRDLKENGCDEDIKYILFPGKPVKNRHKSLLAIQEEESEEIEDTEEVVEDERSDDEEIENQEGEVSKNDKIQYQACIATSTY